MPTYTLLCDKCSHTEEVFLSMKAWEGLDTNRGEHPFPKKCPKCKSKEYHRVFEAPTVMIPCSPAQIKEDLKRQIRDDKKQIASGNMDFIENLAGTSPRKVDNKVKYMKDVKKGVVKRKSS